MINSTNVITNNTYKDLARRMYLLKHILIIFFILLFLNPILANNLQITNELLVEQNFEDSFVMVQFDISWDNSWRVSNAPSNYDGIWLFIKYKKSSDGNWYHSTLNLNSSNHNPGSQGTEATIQVTNTGTGAMFHRSNNGTGTFTSSNVRLRWEYGIDNIGDTLNTEISEIKIFGIEMVYVPEGAYYLGSGGDEDYHFYTYPDETTPYLVNSEGAINFGQENGNLWAWQLAEISTIPNSFPKGYESFWCMKYEITQEQYVDFLNTLTRTQQNNVTKTDISGINIVNVFVMRDFPTMTYRNGIRCDSTLPPSPTPVTFYCDFNSNGIPNEINDGQNIACNLVCWSDATAYADWAGMRPITELEFEKASRGNSYPVPNDCAWGSSSFVVADGVSNSGYPNETASNADANCNGYIYSGGPMRVGCFTGGSRESSGASYYGIMELSGNLREWSITVSSEAGRNFSGILGDGAISSSGYANVDYWPGLSPSGSGQRGGGWRSTNSIQVSNRIAAYFAVSNDSRLDPYGFRCCVKF